MSGGKCISCQGATEPVAGAGAKDQNDQRERHWAQAAISGARLGYAIESAKGDVLICSACLPALIAQAIRHQSEAS